MKAVGLFSGGLDSLLAIKVIQEQGIDVVAVAFRSPFFISNEKMQRMKKVAKENKFKVHFIEFDEKYIRLIRNPKHGHGKHINPCIDCHAYMIKKAKKYADSIRAKFLFTGEVLDERPMSQNKQSLGVVAKESGLKGKLLRPLSAKLLEETIPEKKGYVNREKLLDLSGRGRTRQIELAKKYKIKEFETPAGGCLLTEKHYANTLKDLFKNNKKVSINDIQLIKFGRNFRYKGSKIIVGRNEEDNNALMKMKKKGDVLFDAKDFMSPITLLRGNINQDSIKIAASLTARYSDCDKKTVLVKYGKEKFNKEIRINKIEDKKIEEMRI